MPWGCVHTRSWGPAVAVCVPAADEYGCLPHFPARTRSRTPHPPRHAPVCAAPRPPIHPQEVILYTTISGTIGALYPVLSKDDGEFLGSLELFLRADETLSLVGRDHVSFRSYFAPVKVRNRSGLDAGGRGARGRAVFSRARPSQIALSSSPGPHSRRPPSPARPSQNIVDGDLCETYGGLSAARQKAIAGDLDRSPQDVLKKLEDVRAKVM